MKKLILICLGLLIVGFVGVKLLPQDDLPSFGEIPEERQRVSQATHTMTPKLDVNEKALPEPIPNEPVIKTPSPSAPRAYRFGPSDLVLKNKLELELGREATYASQRDKRVDGWRLVCGAPLETDGQAFNYETSRLKSNYQKGYVENRFCALFKGSGEAQELVAFDIGSTDNYLVGWREALNFPSELTE